MKKASLLVLCLTATQLSYCQTSGLVTTSARSIPPVAAKLYGALPLSFAASDAQSEPHIDYVTRGSGYAISLSRNQVEVHLGRRSGASKLERSTSVEGSHDSMRESTVRMLLHASQPGARGVGVGELPGKVNYLIGNDPSKWRSGVPTYAKVQYADVYPGIDVVYYGNQKSLEFDFNLKPGADASAVRLQFAADEKRDGQLTLKINSAGDLLINNSRGEMVLPKPVIYQEAAAGRPAAERQQIQGGYFLAGAHEVGFRIDRYDKGRTLVIDPTVAYSAMLGGGGYGVTEATGIAVDAAGNAYVTGYTMSEEFPTSPGAVEKTPSTAFVSKFNASGTALLYSTYFGNAMSGTFVQAIAVDTYGDAYLTGFVTDPENFPTTRGAFQTTLPELTSPAFISKLNQDGSSLVYSTFVGGNARSSSTSAEAIDVDASGNAYITGVTLSADFPTTPGSYLSKPPPFDSNPDDAFVTKINASGSALVYSTFLAPNYSHAYGIKVDSSGAAYVTGFTAGPTNTPTFPVTPNAFSNTGTGFVSKLNPSGSDLVYSTLLRGTYVVPYALAINKTGNAYVTGTTFCDLPSTPDAYQIRCKDKYGDAFVTELNPTGTALVFSTYLGGSQNSTGHAIAVNSKGDVNISGETYASDFPTTQGAFESAYRGFGSNEGFFAQLNATGTELFYSTFTGGSSESSTGIAVDASDNVLVTGYSLGSAPPTTPGSYRGPGAGSWVIKFAPSVMTGTALTLSASSSSGTFDQPTTFTAMLSPSAEASGRTDGEYVSFYVDGAFAGEAKLVSGVAKISDSRLPPGSDTITAVYSGDANFSSSTSSALSFHVTAAATKVVLSPDRNPQSTNEPVSLTAMVSPSSTNDIPTGNVSFFDGQRLLGNVPLSAGLAQVRVRFETSGQHTLTAVYVSDHGNFAGSSSAALVENIVP